MGYVLLWVENLTVWLLITALLLACIGRIQRRWLRRVLWWPTWMVLVLPIALLATFWLVVVVQQYGRGHSGSLLLCLIKPLIWIVGFAIGSFWLWIRGLRRVNDGLSPTVAGRWPRGKLTVICLAAIALHSITFWNLDLAARQQLAALRVESQIVELSIAPPRVLDRDNAAILYEQAFKAMGAQESWPKAFAEWCDQLERYERKSCSDEISSPEMQQFVQKMQSVIDLLHEAAARPGCYFESDYPWLNSSSVIPVLGKMRSLPALLTVDARLKMARGDYHEAIEDINTLFGMARHVSAEPLSLYASHFFETLAVDAIQHLLSDNRVSREEVANLTIEESFRYSIVLERYLRAEEAVQMASSCRDGYGESKHGVVLYLLLGYGYDQLPKRVSPILDWFYSALSRPHSDYFTGNHKFFEELHQIIKLPCYEAKERLENLADSLPFYAGALSRFVDLAAHYAEDTAAAESRRRLARLGVAAYCFREKNGRFPEKLEALTPEYLPCVPTDPFDGEPMRMKRTDRGLVIYSIRRHILCDNSLPWTDHPQTGDITFELTDKAP